MSELHKRMHQQLLDMLGATDHEDAARIIAGFQGATLSAQGEADAHDLAIGRRWREDCSLETWFPITARSQKSMLEQITAATDILRPYFKNVAPMPGDCMIGISREVTLCGYARDVVDQLKAMQNEDASERAAVPEGWKITRTDDAIFPVRIAGPEGHVWHPEGGSPAARLALALLTAATQPPEGARVVDEDGLYYLQDSRSYVGNCPQWWAKDRAGYTSRLDEAHRFTFDEAMQQHRERDTDIPWPCAEIDSLARRTVDHQHMRSIREQRAKLSDAPTLDGKDGA